jgi:hypothetical protein
MVAQIFIPLPQEILRKQKNVYLCTRISNNTCPPYLGKNKVNPSMVEGFYIKSYE